MKTRRSFFKATSLALAAPAVLPFSGLAAHGAEATKAAVTKFQVGMAGYSFKEFTVEQTITMMNRIGVNMLSLKEMHLPFDCTPEKATEVVQNFKAGGITVYTVGVIYMKDKAEVDRAFDYAKKVGVALIIGVPEYDLLTYTEEKVKSTGIRIAIHNHGPEDKRYPGPKDVYDRIKNLDARMGLCLDIGHAARAGADVAKAVVDYQKRLFDLHIKDVSKAAQDGKAIEIGRGAIDFPALVKALQKVGYDGKCSIEFEKDMKDPLPGMAESVGFFKGVVKSV